MEQFIELLPTIIGALLVVGGGTFALVRWLFGREDKRREKEQLERDVIEAAKREAEEKIWTQVNATIDRLQEEVLSLRKENKALRQEIRDLRAAIKQLRKRE
jgi:predicted RNase H-like nuclease (RuvC/YqgF family)